MEIKRFLVIIFSILLVLSFSGCVRPASQAPTGASTPTSAGSAALPTTSDDVMDELSRAATQTFVATAGVPEEATATPTTAEMAAETPSGVEETQPAPTDTPAAPTETSAPVSFATATPGIPATYTLQTGEHPYCIARRFNVNPNDLLAASGLSAGSTFYAGMTLTIPKTGNPFPAARALKAHPTNYTVAGGDTIYSIACAFGDADPNAIIAANNLQPPYSLTAGQSLYIP